MARSFLLVGLLGLSLSLATACGGIVEGESATDSSSNAEPPVVDTRFTLRIDDRTVELDEPTATRFVESDGLSYLSLNAMDARRGGDTVEGASSILPQPLTKGTFDCTPDAEGNFTKGYALSPGHFGFSATLEDCRITVIYVSPDRVVGSFTVKGHAPEGSSLDGTVSTATGEFDIPITTKKL